MNKIPKEAYAAIILGAKIDWKAAGTKRWWTGAWAYIGVALKIEILSNPQLADSYRVGDVSWTTVPETSPKSK